MAQFRHRLMWLFLLLLVTVALGTERPSFAEEIAEADAKVVTVENSDTRASSGPAKCDADQAECSKGCEKDAAQQKLATPSSGSSILELIFSRNTRRIHVDASAADASAAAAANDEPADAQPADDESAFAATHRQVALLKVTRDGAATADPPARPRVRGGWGVKSFCLDHEDNLLVAVGDSQAGQLLLLDPQGERKQSWDLTVVPEAVHVDLDGHYMVAGEGKIMKLGRDGEVLLEAVSPLIAELNENKDQIRKQVIDQMKARAQSMALQRDRYQQRIDTVLKSAVRRLDRDERAEYSLLERRLEQYAAMDSEEISAEEQNAWALRKVLFRMLRAKVEQSLTEREVAQRELYRKQMERYDAMAIARGNVEPTEEKIEAAMKSMIAYKSKVASISSAGGEVYIATGASQGYGYDVYRFDENLESPEKIVTQLRGCCGQMDVQACEAGLFVAENSRHQVRHFDREGEKVNEWGSRARSGVRGFGGCCNPMNVAFGPDGTVYTAESNSGRIKRFSEAGDLMELVGSVELVPGCKKVSIAVTKDHKRVYMLDITRNHIIVMEAKPETDQVVSQPAQKNAS